MKADPEEWARAVALEKEIQDNDPQGAGLFLHSSRVPLPLADLSFDASPGPLFRHCQDAGCYT